MNTKIMFKLVYYQYSKLPSIINQYKPPCASFVSMHCSYSPVAKFKSFTATARTSIKNSWVGEGARLLSWERVKEGPDTGWPPGSTLHETAGWWERPEKAVSSPDRIWVRICVTVASEAESQSCQISGMPDSPPDSSEAGTGRTPELVDAGLRCRTRRRPELGRTPELVNADFAIPDPSDAGTRRRPELVNAGARCRTVTRIVHFLVLVLLRPTNFSLPNSSPFWPVRSPLYMQGEVGQPTRNSTDGRCGLRGVADDGNDIQ